MALSFELFTIKDSFRFLSSSLDTLVKLNKYDNDNRLDKWTERFKFTNSNPYVKNDHDLDLRMEKEFIHMTIDWLLKFWWDGITI